MVGPGGDAAQIQDAPGDAFGPGRRLSEAHRELLLEMAATAERFAVTEDQLARVLSGLADRGGLTRIASEVWPLKRVRAHVQPVSER